MYYWKNKEENKNRAIKHTEWAQQTLPNAISDCVEKSVIYDETVRFKPKEDRRRDDPPAVRFVHTTTTDAIFQSHDMKLGKVACLNFASYKTPGGKFIEGSMAQEESLCHNSILYNILREFENSFYKENRKSLNRGLYLNRAIYTPDVTFVDEAGRLINCDVITCAAPNAGAAIRNGVPNDIISLEMMSRCKFVLDIAADNNVDAVILGAFGCGVFKNNPITVAIGFEDLIVRKKYADMVIFAIPDENEMVFKATFDMDRIPYNMVKMHHINQMRI